MKSNQVHVLYKGDEPSLLVIYGEEYEWSGQFNVPIRVLTKLTLEELPLNIPLKPYKHLERGQIIHPVEGDFTLMRTRDGVFATVEDQQYAKYWTHPIISLPCYMSCLQEELQAGNEFKILYFGDEEGMSYAYAFETKLEGIEHTKEAIKLAKHAVTSLEKRVNIRIVKKVKQWAESLA